MFRDLRQPQLTVRKPDPLGTEFNTNKNLQFYL